ncbi:MAG TPA: hypothetical protein VFK05_03435 [Polyangiaceae bacterium]|nr:hypothetical protein [Polyangiaceae bacterium]
MDEVAFEGGGRAGKRQTSRAIRCGEGRRDNCRREEEEENEEKSEQNEEQNEQNEQNEVTAKGGETSPRSPGTLTASRDAGYVVKLGH